MNQQELFALIERMERSTLQRIKIIDGDFQVELEKQSQVVTMASGSVSTQAHQPMEDEPQQPMGEFVRAPLVGTYYAASSPDAPHYVALGQRVKQGETLFLIEAMKTMNEISAPCDMIVEEFVASDGALVAYDAPIIRYSHV